MATSESKGRFFLQNKSIRIDSHNESNRIDSNRELECSTDELGRSGGLTGVQSLGGSAFSFSAVCSYRKVLAEIAYSCSIDDSQLTKALLS